MCGITGIMAFNLLGSMHMMHLATATAALKKRGPDHQDMYLENRVGLGHRRLSIIDTSAASHQPLWDESRRYCIVFNGEIFNYAILRQSLLKSGFIFSSQGDGEVLLNLFIRDGEACLQQLNGFFAFCIYDKQAQTFFLARDRFGVKPLLYLHDEDKFIFASEMKSLIRYGIDKTFDAEAITAYLQLNYIPAPKTVFKHVHKVLPGHWLKVKKGDFQLKKYYQITYSETPEAKNFEQAKTTFKKLLTDAVQRRLVSDVPLGTFLSGGLDSSVVTGIARHFKTDLQTFSIGFRDAPFFDETKYAQLVAKKFNTRHTVFSLTNTDLYSHVNDILDYLDEPFADSSAINVYILSKYTRQKSTVALSGDGADELLGGYNKHAALLRAFNQGWNEKLVATALPLLKQMPQSRNGSVANKIRQAIRYAEGAALPLPERYWKWASFASHAEALNLLAPSMRAQCMPHVYENYRQELLQPLTAHPNMNGIFQTDMQLVLPNDMLIKVDWMSMANSLEVRTPFLDVDVVNFIFSLPADFKITPTIRKRLLQETFRDFLPPELYNRPKKGFEVPMLQWLRTEMRGLIENDLLSESFLGNQGLFDYPEIKKLKNQLYSSNPGDSHARIWGLLVFQWWWRKMIGGDGS